LYEKSLNNQKTSREIETPQSLSTEVAESRAVIASTEKFIAKKIKKIQERNYNINLFYKLRDKYRLIDCIQLFSTRTFVYAQKIQFLDQFCENSLKNIVYNYFRQMPENSLFLDHFCNLVEKHGVSDCVRLSGFSVRGENPLFLDHFDNLIEKHGIMDCLRLFSPNAFVVRSQNPLFLEQFRKLIEKYGVPDCVKLFSTVCLQSELKIHYILNNFTSSLKKYGVHDCVKLFSTRAFSVRSQNPLEFCKLIDIYGVKDCKTTIFNQCVFRYKIIFNRSICCALRNFIINFTNSLKIMEYQIA